MRTLIRCIAAAGAAIVATNVAGPATAARLLPPPQADAATIDDLADGTNTPRVVVQLGKSTYRLGEGQSRLANVLTQRDAAQDATLLTRLADFRLDARRTKDGERKKDEDKGTVADLLVLPVVPEPGTWAMLILGFGAIGGALRRRRRRTAGFVRGVSAPMPRR